MAAPEPTYTFKDDQVFALVGDKVIASGKDVDEVEKKVKDQSFEDYVDEQDKSERKKKSATHIVTPNGLKGKIMGRVASNWGEQLTVRFENNQIVTLNTDAQPVEYVNESSQKTASATPLDALQARIDADFDGDLQSLRDRREELRSIKTEASETLRKGASYIDEVKLNDIVVTADAELAEVGEAIDHLESEHADSFAPPAPFDPQVVEQESVGGNPGTWLDSVTQQLVDAASEQDFDSLLREGPDLFVTELDNAQVADAGATREVALSYITEKTAGVEADELERYKQLFLARVEEARREELAVRKEAARREASAQDEDTPTDDVPDEALFS